MADPFRILIVEDDPFMREVLLSALSTEYSVECADTGAQCLLAAQASPPDMVLLDIELPDISGYEICRRLCESAGTSGPHITFLSGHESLDSRMQAYEAGGHDFIAKPVERDELLRKVGVARRQMAELRQLREQASFSTTTAMTAMMSMGELGVVLQFLRKSFSAADYAALADLVTDALGQYGLRGAVQIRDSSAVTNRRTPGVQGMLHESVFAHLKDVDRIFEFNTRAIVNYERVSILIENMPPDDADRRGRIRDNVALLAEGADARVRAIEMEHRANERQRGLLRAVDSLHSTLQQLQKQQESSREQAWRLSGEMRERLEASFLTLGLSEGQEASLLELTHAAMGKVEGIAAMGDEFEAKLSALVDSLEPLIREQR